MTIFHHLCNHPIEERVEFVEGSHRDISQDTWLTYFERLLDIPSIQTFDELVHAFENDAALLSLIYKNQRTEHYRRQHGHSNSPNKRKLLHSRVPLDEDFDAEDTNDLFTKIEEIDLLENDERIKKLPEEHQEAIKRFIVAWSLIEDGYTLPSSLQKQISRDRKLTGLPLVLPRGNDRFRQKKRTNFT